MIGDWAMVRGNGRPICGLTLTNTEAAGQFPGLPQAALRSGGRSFAPTMWRLERGELLLFSANGEPGVSKPTTTPSGGACPTPPIR